jgi:hypothetical protein
MKLPHLFSKWTHHQWPFLKNRSNEYNLNRRNTYQSIFLETCIAKEVVTSVSCIRTYYNIIHALVSLALMASVECKECGSLPIFSFWSCELGRHLCLHEHFILFFHCFGHSCNFRLLWVRCTWHVHKKVTPGRAGPCHLPSLHDQSFPLSFTKGHFTASNNLDTLSCFILDHLLGYLANWLLSCKRIVIIGLLRHCDQTFIILLIRVLFQTVQQSASS